VGQCLDTALALSQQIQQLEALTATQRLTDAAQRLEQRILGSGVAHTVLQTFAEHCRR
jgi:hypothetical protein